MFSGLTLQVLSLDELLGMKMLFPVGGAMILFPLVLILSKNNYFN